MKKARGPQVLRVLVADAHRLVADAIAESLGSLPDIEALAERPGNAQEAVRIAAHSSPDLMILDYWMPGMEPAATVKMTAAAAPRTGVVVLSWLYAPEQIAEVVEAGAVAFLPKSATMEDLAATLRLAAAGEVPVHAERLEALAGRVLARREQVAGAWEGLSALTPREIEVLKILDQGGLVEEVARRLSIKPATVRNYLQSIRQKTGARTQLQAVAMARHFGLIRQ